MTDLFILLKKIHIKMNSADKVIKVVTLEKVEFCTSLASIDSN